MSHFIEEDHDGITRAVWDAVLPRPGEPADLETGGSIDHHDPFALRQVAKPGAETPGDGPGLTIADPGSNWDDPGRPGAARMIPGARVPVTAGGAARSARAPRPRVAPARRTSPVGAALAASVAGAFAS